MKRIRSIVYIMAVTIGMVSQKGGVGKSTLSRLVAREYALAGWNVKIADLDVSQGTSFNWQSRRLQAGIEPIVPVERFGTVEQALKIGSHYDLLILDGPPHSTAGTLKIAAASLLTVLPTGLSLDDLEPSVLLAHELRKRGVTPGNIAFALSRVGDSETEIEEARQLRYPSWLPCPRRQLAGKDCLPSCLRRRPLTYGNPLSLFEPS
ncbi:MAG: ParA family protein [Janthinobacterium lividum]